MKKKALHNYAQSNFKNHTAFPNLQFFFYFLKKKNYSFILFSMFVSRKWHRKRHMIQSTGDEIGTASLARRKLTVKIKINILNFSFPYLKMIQTPPWEKCSKISRTLFYFSHFWIYFLIYRIVFLFLKLVF